MGSLVKSGGPWPTLFLGLQRACQQDVFFSLNKIISQHYEFLYIFFNHDFAKIYNPYIFAKS
jgi:hypothetical protein